MEGGGRKRLREDPMDPKQFTPPRCPNRGCAKHWQPTPAFFRRVGSYRPRCRTVPVPRFECRDCGRGFSRQTFRLDYRDRRPELNAPLFERLTGGATLRHCSRTLGADCKTIQRKFRKLSRHLRILDRSLLRRLPSGCTLVLDEQEDFETTRTKPVTIPVVVERVSKLVVAVDVAAIRRVARKGSRGRRRLERQESREGRRRDDSRRCLRHVFGRLARLLEGKNAALVTDCKSSYATECRRIHQARFHHLRVPSDLPKDVASPLFPVHLAQSMIRCSNARMRRRSWAKSKSRRMLRLQLAMFAAFRNWHRQRHNADPRSYTPGVCLGLVARRLEAQEMLAWRQDWRERSAHPLSQDGSTCIANFGS